MESGIERIRQVPTRESRPGHDSRVRTALTLRKLLCALLLIPSWCVLNGGTRIGADATLELPTSALWSSIINFVPGDGETVSINPPIFKWSYHPMPQQANDGTVRSFRFQVAYESSFRSPVVNILTSNNVYNCLAPFTNASAPIHWRVAYLDPVIGATNAWSAVRQFRISGTARTWDRSMLADPAYLAAKGVHPHMLFNADNRESMLAFLHTNNVPTWNYVTNWTYSSITQSWWNTPSATNVYSGEWAKRVASVAFLWQLTRDPVLRDSNPAAALNDMATYYLQFQWDMKDVVSGGADISFIRCLGYGYDWLYEILTPAQRATVLGAIEANCRWILRRYWWYSSAGDPNRIYPGPYTVPRDRAPLIGGSHQNVNYLATMIAALAAYPDSASIHEFLEYGLNYALAQVYPFGTGDGLNQGRLYLYYGAFGRNYALHVAMNLDILFPEAQWRSHPFWNGVAEWWEHMNPIGMAQGHEPWGDTGWGRQSMWQYLDHRDLALFVASPEAYQHHKNEYAIRDRYIPPDDFGTMCFLYHYSTPPLRTNAFSARVFPGEGWAIAASQPPNTPDAFTNGVGFIFQARPRGSEVSHSTFSDGSFQMWAYGAMLTDAGSGNYSKHSMQHYTLLVDGLGMYTQQRFPIEPWYSRLIAWTNSTALTYVAADLTRAYVRSNVAVGGYGLTSDFATRYSGAPLSHVTNVNRHLVFPRKKYFVVYDVLQTTRPATFSWLYHVLEPTAVVKVSDCSFRYTATNYYNGSNVTVYVQHIVRPDLMTLTNMSGTANVRRNPITGEDYTSIEDSHFRAHAIWVSNSRPTNDWHFMTVIYPVRWDDVAPVITRVDDYTARIQHGSENDTVSFNSNNTTASIVVDVARVGAAPPASPTGIRVVSP